MCAYKETWEKEGQEVLKDSRHKPVITQASLALVKNSLFYKLQTEQNPTLGTKF